MHIFCTSAHLVNSLPLGVLIMRRRCNLPTKKRPAHEVTDNGWRYLTLVQTDQP